MKNRILAAALMVFTPVGGQANSRAAQPAGYFPLKRGSRQVYISFAVNRANPKKKALHTESIWRDVVDEQRIHGARVLVVSNSKGRVSYKGRELDMGTPERVESEDIFIITPAGVDWRVHYENRNEAEGLDQTREKLLDSFRKMPRKRFLAQLDNWILPLPAKAHTVRYFDANSGEYRVLARGDETLLRADIDRKTLVGVSATQMGRWKATRWFQRGKGLVQLEMPNSDPETASEYPVTCEQLMQSAL